MFNVHDFFMILAGERINALDKENIELEFADLEKSNDNIRKYYAIKIFIADSELSIGELRIDASEKCEIHDDERFYLKQFTFLYSPQNIIGQQDNLYLEKSFHRIYQNDKSLSGSEIIVESDMVNKVKDILNDTLEWVIDNDLYDNIDITTFGLLGVE